ncbi:CobW domain protein [Aspergillus pseudonomiae]|uniref:galacturonan 1,4-alpha-galacturonidase n=1 Tax=Aspergillus pseudonomiae TaxID=1506151 RepID=A0A5N7DAH1_9EURO|nr:CobW domain protein [Aspergillus pseudonomiae]KAE8403234.1 CobW domain protein [Aspergillus pseudonomiae]
MKFFLATLFASAVSSIAVDKLIPGAQIIPESDTRALERVGGHHAKYHDRRTITIRPSRNDTDDVSRDFLWGIKHANHGGRLLLKKGEKYVIGRKLDLTFLDNIEVQLDGELKFTDDVSYWQENNFYYDFQKSITFWRWGGKDIKIFGTGLLNGNGQRWYNEFAGQEILNPDNDYYRPILFLTENATRVSVEGITQLNSPCWTNFFIQSKDVSFDDVYIHAFSTNKSAEPKNSDGFDSLNVDGLKVTNTRVDVGDDCFSPKPNTTNIFVQNLWCNNTHGVSMGSIGQYPGVMDIIENAYIENVTLLNGQNGARLKAWAGKDVGYGRINNITYKNIHIENTDAPVVLDQCYFDIEEAECAQYPSQVNVTNILFENISGTSSGKNGKVVADLVCSPNAVCSDIQLKNIDLTSPSGSPPEIICDGVQGDIGGSGKTTLLEHILQSDHGFKIAVVVNDMSSLNIDATLIKNHHVSQTKENLIQLQNGCICCTLRGDLLEELARLTKQDDVQYVVIESTGISEPMQVAETFTAEFSAAMLEADVADEEGKKILNQIVELGGLHKLAKLDTTVTVIDAFNLLTNFDTAEFLSDRYGGEIIPEDERTISDLMVDQIEFADVIIINKIETVDEKTRERIRSILKLLNPDAKVLETNYSKVDVNEILDTGRFNFLKAASGAGWLRSLHEMTKRETGNGERLAPVPETVEYGINNFVYKARRPFHPRRLFSLIHDKFIVLQNVETQENDGSEEEHNGSETEEEEEEEIEDDEDDEMEDFPQPDPQEILSNKRSHPVFRPILRSKGFFWLATRPYQFGEWSQAGGMLTIGCGGPWFAEVPDEAWPEDADVRKSIEDDFQGPWGDRRQEIVFIGEGIETGAITDLLNECLLNDREMKTWESIMKKKRLSRGERQEKMMQTWEDGWEEWPPLEEEEDEPEQVRGKHRISEHLGHGHSHNHNHSHRRGIKV